jgi:hypothetical protein
MPAFAMSKSITPAAARFTGNGNVAQTGTFPTFVPNVQAALMLGSCSG